MSNNIYIVYVTVRAYEYMQVDSIWLKPIDADIRRKELEKLGYVVRVENPSYAPPRA